MICIKERMGVIGVGGVHVDTADRVVGGRIERMKVESGKRQQNGYHHYFDRSLVEGDKDRLSGTHSVAMAL